MYYNYTSSQNTFSRYNANLYSSTLNPKAIPFPTKRAITDYITTRVLLNKILVSIPLYSYFFKQTLRLGHGFTSVGLGSQQNRVQDYKDLLREGTIKFLDIEASALYSYNTIIQELISYNSIIEVNIKSAFIKKNNLNRAFYQESSSNKNGTSSLITIVTKGLGSLNQSKNQLSYLTS